MKRYKYVHIIHNDKFIVPFIDFIEKHFRGDEHLFIFAFDNNTVKFPIPKGENILDITNRYPGRKNILRFSAAVTPYVRRAEKVILHSLFSSDLVHYLYLHRWFLKKCYLVMWGGDYYFPEKQSRFKHRVIRDMGHFISGTPGEYDYVKKQYGAKGGYIKAISYPSNIFKERAFKPRTGETVRIMVGNSSDPTNNHLEIFEKLLPYKEEDIEIVVPLSYPNPDNARRVAEAGESMFGAKFKALTAYLSLEAYVELLSGVDIAIFNHNRQQAFGNMVTLLGLGKKVYVPKRSTLMGTLEEYGIKVYDTDTIDLTPIDDETREHNIRMIKENFSEQALVEGYRLWIDD